MPSPTRPEYSVVIPTYERMDVLPEVLAALEEQTDDAGTAVPSFEVVVVDDGSGDGTAELLRRREEELDGVLRTFRQENAGPARARNRGVAEAKGDRVAFLGDDTVPTPGWLAAHERRRREAEGAGLHQHVAVIGYTRWHPRMDLTPFLRYINEYGLQFGYELIDDPDDVPFNFLYTSNLSLPRRLLLEEPFDLGFPYAAWEDIELAYRLKKRGLGIVYQPEAVVDHDHPTDLRRFMQRQEKAGYSAVVFHRLHPELGAFLGLGDDGPPPLPPRWRQALRERLACSLQHLPVSLPELWDELLRWHYIRGLHRGWRDVARSAAEPPKTEPPPRDIRDQGVGP